MKYILTDAETRSIEEEFGTLEEAEEQLIEWIEDDLKEDLYEPDSYAIFDEDGELVEYDSEVYTESEVRDNTGTQTEADEEAIRTGNIPEELFKNVLYSINKHAKNARNEARNPELLRWQQQQLRTERDAWYDKKNILLSIFEPTEVQVQFKTIYEGEEAEGKQAIYFYVFDIFGYKAHSIIDKEEAIASGLEINEIDESFRPEGEDIHELLSPNFIDEFMKMIKSEKYKII